MLGRLRTVRWRSVRLIFGREVRDQFRDRRTLFMITVLPILLYPMLGMVFLQILQFQREHTSRVLVLGAPTFAPGVPALFEPSADAQTPRFAAGLTALLKDDLPSPLGKRNEDHTLDLTFLGDAKSVGMRPDDAVAQTRRMVQSGEFDAALFFPADFSRRLDAFRAQLAHRENPAGKPDPSAAAAVPSPEIIYTDAREKSQLACVRLNAVLRAWLQEIGEQNLADSGVPPLATHPFDVKSDNASGVAASASVTLWSKLLPVLLLIWALTGGFYPAIDLCAGEKERGTMETLLSSPAERIEIVLGKLLTIMLFSMLTALLNVISISCTGSMLFGQIANFGPPPALALVWIPLALVPVSALFSGLSLALAAFARSSKEGQYYLMPLLLISAPLAVMPTAPGVELTLGNSLIPVAGIVLLLKTLLEGSYWQAAQFAPLVIAVNMACCVLAVRWAVDQFNSEAVLFREGERLEMGLWLYHLHRDREPTPPVSAAVFCAVLILMLRFAIGMAAGSVPSANQLTLQAVMQLAGIFTPAVFMTLFLTSSPRQTLLLRWPDWRTLPAAVLLAVAVHPVMMALRHLIDLLYPMSDRMKAALAEMMKTPSPAWMLFLLLAVLPAICEEVAFRGFILSGLRHLGRRSRAIVYSAVIFGVTHMILQQSISAAILGVVLGLIAVQSRSILPGMLFHMLHNSLALASAMVIPELLRTAPGLELLVKTNAEGVPTYHWAVVVGGAMLAAAILRWFCGLPWNKTQEEALQDAIDRAALVST